MSRKKEKAHKQEKEKRNNCFSFFVFLSLLFIIVFLSLNVRCEDTFIPIDLNKIEEVELLYLKENYKNEKIEDRLSRLENFLLGKSFESEPIKNRIAKILSTTNKEKEIKNTTVGGTPEQEPTPVYRKNESSNLSNESGILNNIGKIEDQIFGHRNDHLLFPQRIEMIEDKLLNRTEKAKYQNSSLLERVNVLVNKSMILNDTSSNTSNTDSYVIDKTTGFLINQKTGEYLKDSFGNPISVNRQTNYTNPLGDLENIINPQKQLNPQFGTQYPYNQFPQNNYSYPSRPNIPNNIPPELLLQLQNFGGTDNFNY